MFRSPKIVAYKSKKSERIIAHFNVNAYLCRHIIGVIPRHAGITVELRHKQ